MIKNAIFCTTNEQMISFANCNRVVTEDEHEEMLPSYLRGVCKCNITPPASDTGERLVGVNVIPTSFDI